MLNLVMLACLNRMHEWELHLNGALRNGVTRDEIQAILHQIAVYAGVPLAVECFRIARKVFAEVDAKARRRSGQSAWPGFNGPRASPITGPATLPQCGHSRP